MQIHQISELGRNAIRNRDWETVATCAHSIIQQAPSNAEGYFFAGYVERAANRPVKAAAAFEKALQIDPERYDAAIELANQYSVSRRNGEAAALLDKYQDMLSNSPMYLDLAGTIYTEIGLAEKAWPLYVKANELQPEVDLFQANMAACGVYLGKIDLAKKIYKNLLARFPNHQRNHYQLSRLATAKDDEHIKQMQAILQAADAPADKNIFLYYAIGKELEDLQRWDEAFAYYKQGGDAVSQVAKYKLEDDLKLIDTIIQTCDETWLAEPAVGADMSQKARDKAPIFIVGLPRTGTTLTERIISSHSQVSSLGETNFLQMVIRRESGVQSIENMNAEMIVAAAKKTPALIAEGYTESVNYRLAEEKYFIDKMPMNFLYLGFIAKAWPDAKIVHLVRNPVDACFSMYKQVFTWAYKYSYQLDTLADYYIAYDKLRQHWQTVLGDRLIEVEYESLVSNTDEQTKTLLNRLNLSFDEACLEFDRNTAPSATASSVQVREKAHQRSIKKWQQFEQHLKPLVERLAQAGIECH